MKRGHNPKSFSFPNSNSFFTPSYSSLPVNFPASDQARSRAATTSKNNQSYDFPGVTATPILPPHLNSFSTSTINLNTVNDNRFKSDEKPFFPESFNPPLPESLFGMNTKSTESAKEENVEVLLHGLGAIGVHEATHKIPGAGPACDTIEFILGADERTEKAIEQGKTPTEASVCGKIGAVTQIAATAGTYYGLKAVTELRKRTPPPLSTLGARLTKTIALGSIATTTGQATGNAAEDVCYKIGDFSEKAIQKVKEFDFDKIINFGDAADPPTTPSLKK